MTNNNRSYEFAGESSDAAIEKGLAELGLSRTGVSVEVLEEGQDSFLGMGGREARVRLTVLTDEAAAESPAEDAVVEAEIKPEPEVAESVAEEPAETVEDSSADEEFDEFDDLEDLPDPELMDEMDLAEEVLLNIIEGMDLEVEIEARFSKEDDLGKQVIEFNLTGPDANKLLGTGGDIMADLQFLVRLMISQKVHRRANVTIDIDGHRSSKREGLTRLAERMALKVVERQRPVTLEPMNPYERRLVHIALHDDATVKTESIGEGTQRRVRILPIDSD